MVVSKTFFCLYRAFCARLKYFRTTLVCELYPYLNLLSPKSIGYFHGSNKWPVKKFYRIGFCSTKYIDRQTDGHCEVEHPSSFLATPNFILARRHNRTINTSSLKQQDRPRQLIKPSIESIWHHRTSLNSLAVPHRSCLSTYQCLLQKIHPVDLNKPSRILRTKTWFLSRLSSRKTISNSGPKTSTVNTRLLKQQDRPQ